MFGNPDGLRRILSQDASKPQHVTTTLARFARYFTRYWPLLLAVAALVSVNTWTQVTTPELLGQAVDCYLVSGAETGLAFGAANASASASSNCWLAVDHTVPSARDWAHDALRQAIYTGTTAPTLSQLAAMTIEERLAGLTRVIATIVALYVTGALLIGSAFFIMTWTGQQVLRVMRVQLFEHLHQLSIGYYTEHEAGELMSRITNDTSAIEQAFGFALLQVFGAALLLVWIIYNMLVKSLPFALLSLLVLPAMVLATVWFSEQARVAFRKSRRELGSVNAELQEKISAAREVQAFNRADENIQQFREINAANRDANVRAVAFTSALAPALEALGYVALALVTGVGGYLLFMEQDLWGATVSLGLVITFLGYVQRFNQPVQQIALLWTNVQNAIAGGERIFQLLDERPAVVNRPNARPLPPITGQVDFVGASAEYKKGVPVLRRVTFSAAPGQTVAIVGPTGAGKTTIINLLPRFWDVTEGAVKIDGHDVRDVTLDSLRRQIGIVLQDTFLFSASVMDNIRFGRPEATDEEVIAAAKLAHADSFIERLPEGYNTILGERGAGLSQGQRQLLAIARAALANPRLLILDEATSSVDTRTERLIQRAFDELLKGRTSFVIAHRLSTIRNADQILVLKQGEIIERGTFESLMAERGFFYDLYMSQFRAAESAGGNGASPEPHPALAPA